MDIRRLQQTGGSNGSSYLVILPKDWVVRQNLKKGHPVVVSEREDGCLIIDPRLPKSVEKRTTSINIESNLRWGITSKYLLGFDEIHVISDKPITDKQRDDLKEVIKRFVALEVTDENEHKLVVQCLVDPSTIPVRRAMRRTSLIASRMLRDAVKSYLEGDIAAAREVQERDEEVDRLFFLIVRELRSAIQYPSISDKMNMAPVEALDFRLAVQYLERIADLAVEIAKTTGDSVDESARKAITEISGSVREMLEKSVTNLFNYDSEKVAWVIQSEKNLIVSVIENQQHLMTAPDRSSRNHLQILDCLLRIGEAAKDIADLALPKS